MKYLTAFVILVGLTFPSAAQVDIRQKVWLGSNLKYGITKKIKLDIGYQYRTTIDAGSYSFNDVGVNFKLKKWLYLAPSYRFTHFSDLNKDYNRASMDVIFKLGKKKSKWKFGDRIRYQLASHVSTAENEHVIRNKVFLSYDVNKKLRFKSSFDLFLGILSLSDARFKLAADYKIHKLLYAKVFYAYESELYRKNLDKTHIFGAQLNVKLKRKKREKK